MQESISFCCILCGEQSPPHIIQNKVKGDRHEVLRVVRWWLETTWRAAREQAMTSDALFMIVSRFIFYKIFFYKILLVLTLTKKRLTNFCQPMRLTLEKVY